MERAPRGWERGALFFIRIRHGFTPLREPAPALLKPAPGVSCVLFPAMKKRVAFLVVSALLACSPQVLNLLLLQLLSSRLEVPVTGTVRWSFWPGTLRLDTLRLLKDARGAPVLRGDVRVFFNPLALVLSRDVELRLEASRVQPLFLSGVLTQELYEALGPLQVKGSLIISRDGVTVRALDAQAAGARLHLAGQVAAKGNLDLRSSVTLDRKSVV